MDNEEALVYQCIKESGSEGIWTRLIKTQTNLHEQVVQRCLKNLEQKALVKCIKGIKSNKKIYMLMELVPSVELTGGAWFSDQELDIEFVETLKDQCYKFIQSKSEPKTKDTLFPEDYKGYATIKCVRKFVVDHKITTVDLSNKDINDLLQMMIFEDLIEKVGVVQSSKEPDWYYRALNKNNLNENDNDWLHEIPCIKCPIYELCYENAAVCPKNCIYLKEWLGY